MAVGGSRDGLLVLESVVHALSDRGALHAVAR
jgi:hypothetical protein